VTLAMNAQALPGSALLGPAMATLAGGVNTPMVWVEVAVPHLFQALTVIVLAPGDVQVKATVSLIPPVWVMEACAVACQA
jgi:hypothetical protein